MYPKNPKDSNFAQKASEDSNFNDPDQEEGKLTIPGGSQIDVTYYSDGSSTHHFGPMAGDCNYDENGEEC